LVVAADPERASRNAKEQVTERRVVAELTSEGTADLRGHDLPPHRVAAAMERLTAIARSAKSGGDSRKLDQLRADAMLDLLVGDGVATGGPVTGTPADKAEAQPTPPQQEACEGDDTVELDHAQLAPFWAAGFYHLRTSRPGCPTCCRGARGVMPGPRKGVVDIVRHEVAHGEWLRRWEAAVTVR
jgi:hypothetical protein